MIIDFENFLLSLKNNLDISTDLGDILVVCVLDIVLNFLR